MSKITPSEENNELSKELNKIKKEINEKLNQKIIQIHIYICVPSFKELSTQAKKIYHF